MAEETTTEGNQQLIVVGQSVTFEQIDSALCSALDPMYGHSYEWCQVLDTTEPQTWDYSPDNETWEHLYPLNPGGALIIKDRLEPKHPGVTLNLETIQSGLQIMSEKYPWHFSDLVTGNDDAITGDVFVQCCVLGEIVYG